MESLQVLDVVEKLHRAARHPDIASVRRYGRDIAPGGQSPAGVALTYQSGAIAYIWSAAAGNPAPAPHDLPAELPPMKLRVQHAVSLVLKLLDFAKPEVFIAWRPVAFAGVDLKPSGLEVRCADGSTVYLRVTSSSGPVGDPDRDEFADYEIPDAVRNV